MSIMLGSRALICNYPDSGIEAWESRIAHVSSITPLECVVPLHVNNGKLRNRWVALAAVYLYRSRDEREQDLGASPQPKVAPPALHLEQVQ